MNYASGINALLTGIAVVGASALIYANLNHAPRCDSTAARELTVSLLGKDLHVPGQLYLHDIRIQSGNLFSRSYQCEASIGGMSPDANALQRSSTVSYTTEWAVDSNKSFVSARLNPHINDIE